METINNRTTNYPIDPMFLERWSPRAFTGEQISEQDLMTILDAARWAPSSYNSQPWRYIYARRDTPPWLKMLGLLGEFNQMWVKNAGALLIIVSSSTMLAPGSDKPVPSHSHSFDAGCGWGFLAIQALKLGWYTHGMVGLDMDRAFSELNVPAGYRVEAAVAIGKLGDKKMLPEGLQAREAPSGRFPLEQIVMEGSFKADK